MISTYKLALKLEKECKLFAAFNTKLKNKQSKENKMKKFKILGISFLFSLLFCFAASFSQGWEVQVSNTTQQLKGLHVISDTEALACGDAGVVLHTTDEGNTWMQNILTGADLHSIVFKNANTGITVGDGGVIFRTENGGASWTPVNSSTGSQLRAAAWGNGDVVWAAGRDGAIVKSTNAGETWVSLNSGTTARFRGVAAFGTNNAWAVGQDGIIKYTSDGGVTWINQNSTTIDDLHDVQFLSELIGFAGGSGSKIIFTSDGGQTWLSRSTGIAMGINGIFFLDENQGWAVSDVGTIYVTSNGGLNWTTEQGNTSQNLNEVFFLSLNIGWAVGDLGAITHYNGAVTNAENQEISPISFNLFQNYPNPFNPSTEINFSVPQSTNVTLKVFNVMGSKIATLIDEQVEAGRHSIVFNAANLSSGVYYYKITTNNFVQTKKMLLLK